MGGELYCDGGIVASNPAAVAIHEARTIYPSVPIELVVSCGTGAFVEEKSEPRIGWDGIIGEEGVTRSTVLIITLICDESNSSLKRVTD